MFNKILSILYLFFFFSFSLIATDQINDKRVNTPTPNVKWADIQEEEDTEILKNRVIEQAKQISLLLSQLRVMEKEKTEIEERNKNLSKHNFNNLLIISQLTSQNTFLENSLNSLQMAYDKIDREKFRYWNLCPCNQYTSPHYIPQPPIFTGNQPRRNDVPYHDQQEYDENTNHSPVYKNNYQQNNKNISKNSFTKRRPKSDQN